MREMKDSGVPWIGEIPAEWEIMPLLKIASKEKYAITDGPFGSDMKTDDYVDSGVPIIQLGNITPNRHKPIPTKFVSEEKAATLSSHYIFPGDIVMAKMMPCGKSAIVSSLFKKYIVAADAIRIKVSDAHDKRFICYCINACSSVEAILGSIGATRARINLGDAKKLRVIIPNIKEQKIIADFLDSKCAEIDSILANTRSTADEYKRLKQSVITEAVTKGICGSRPMKDSGVEWIGQIPSEWSVEPLWGTIRRKTEVQHSGEIVLSLYRDYGVLPKDSRDDNHNVTSLDTSNYKFVEIGDLVVNKMKAWQGSMAISQYQGIVSPAYHVCEIRNPRIYRPYLHYLLRNHLYLPEYLRLSTGMRVGQWDLSYDDLKHIPILIPDLEEQRIIASYLDEKCAAIDSLIASKEALITELEAYKKSLIYEYVTGKKEV